MTRPVDTAAVATTIQSYEFGPQDFRGILRDALEKGASMRFAAAGSSMTPFIKDGDVITVAPPPPELKPGQIAAAVSPANGLVIVHRIVRVGEDEVLLKGDNLNKPDGWVGGADLLGIVAGVERGGEPWRLGITRHARLVAALSRAGLLRPLLRLAVWFMKR